MVKEMNKYDSTKYQPSFNIKSLIPSNNDYLTGLAFCVHSWWGNEIIVKNYSKSGNTYTATLTFIIYDHFGLDKTDLIDGKYPTDFLPGLKSWYILQHYNNSSYSTFAPFVTIMSFDVAVSGTL